MTNIHPSLDVSSLETDLFLLNILATKMFEGSKGFATKEFAIILILIPRANHSLVFSFS